MPRFQSGSGIEVKFYEGWYSNSPRCRHGPMLLFEKYVSGKLDGKRFYGCSACRGRKECNAFLWEEDFEKMRVEEQIIFVGEEEKGPQRKIEHSLEQFLAMEPSERAFCTSCQLMLPRHYANDKGNQCHNHRLHKNLSDDQILQPSHALLKPLDQDKFNAQYFLQEKSLKFLMTTLKELKYTHVICIGMPTLHEAIQHENIQVQRRGDKESSTEKSIDSILLDIDDRYEQFTVCGRFCRFNMFNHHFFEDGLDRFRKYIPQTKHCRICIVLDPPFGGLVDAIVETLKWISELVKETSGTVQPELLPIFWIFPYFMEKRIKEKNLSLTMLDYQVDYENHNKFKKKATSKRISPVRIFTNVPVHTIKLPRDEGYRFCQHCKRYSSQFNKHCDICEICPSKDGRTYVHCYKCGRCVKPGRIHCEKCGRCDKNDHICRDIEEKQIGCHLCGKLTHKRRDCPLNPHKKRKSSSCEDVAQEMEPRTEESCISPASLSDVRNHSFKPVKNMIFHRRSSHHKRLKCL